MTNLEQNLENVRMSLCREVDLGGLYSRNGIAHKWKAPWRSLLLREAVAWRLYDLLSQSRQLSSSSALLGARILLRSAFETLAVLIYLNKSMRSVVRGELDYHLFSDKTVRLLLGSRNQTTSVESINIMSVLQSADKRYPGLENWYASLSECAHPNFEGMVLGYSVDDMENSVTHFENRWESLYGPTHESALLACLAVFVVEYNEEWTLSFEALESWIGKHDSSIAVTKNT